MSRISVTFAFVSLLLVGAIFGFFFAWVCSTMWGLDQLEPQTALLAMQAMNASVRNAVFAPAFFATGPMLLLTAFFTWRDGAGLPGRLFALAGLIYLLGGMVLTLAINVPMNEALALVQPDDPNLPAIWSDYSSEWQFWNQGRTGFSGLSLLVTGAGLYFLRSRS